MHTLEQQKRAQAVLTRLQKTFRSPGMMDFGSAEDRLIATLLSARTRDEQVLKVYPGLRKAFPRLQDLASASILSIEKQIRSIGFFHTKARAIKKLAQMVMEKHDGRVPKTMKELTELPGVGRKTASCVLWYAFGIPAIAVDTHVFRITHRLGWVKGKTPEQVEEELRKNVPEKLWGEMNRVFVQFGRAICTPGKPRCFACPVKDLCPYRPKTEG